MELNIFFLLLSFFFQPSWAIADPVCTFVFSLIVLGTTLAILKDALIVLMEGKFRLTIFTRHLVLEGSRGEGFTRELLSNPDLPRPSGTE